MRLLLCIRSLVCSGESVVAFGLLTAVVVMFPPRDAGLRFALVMVAGIAVTGAGMHAISTASRPGTRLAQVGSLIRATAALATSASVLMVADATMAALR